MRRSTLVKRLLIVSTVTVVVMSTYALVVYLIFFRLSDNLLLSLTKIFAPPVVAFLIGVEIRSRIRKKRRDNDGWPR